MEASLQSYAVKNFKKILVCMSKFGEDLSMQASHEGDFFQKYEMCGAAAESDRPVKCKLLVKSVLSVLGRGTLPANVDRLDLKIIDNADSLRGVVNARNRSPQRRGNKGKSKGKGKQRQQYGSEDEAQESEDDVRSTEARLVVKLVCKHGVLKTHSLNLSPCNFLLAVVDPATLLSRFVVPSRTLRDWSEHFAISGSSTSTPANGTNTTNKYESELGWCFEKESVRMKTWEGGAGGVARRGISTEIKVGVEDFDDYVVTNPPIMMAFPMREFRAAFGLAESLSVPITTSFSQPGQPLSMHLEIEGVRCEFTIATTVNDSFKELKPALGAMAPPPVPSVAGQKRKADTAEPSNAPTTVTHRGGKSQRQATLAFSQAPQRVPSRQVPETQYGREQEREPLFYPAPSSQSEEYRASQAEAIRQSGLGIENMGEDELAEMLDMDDDDLDGDDAAQPNRERHAAEKGGKNDKENDMDMEMELDSGHHETGEETLSARTRRRQMKGRTQIDETMIVDGDEEYEEDDDDAPVQGSAVNNGDFVPLFFD